MKNKLNNARNSLNSTGGEMGKSLLIATGIVALYALIIIGIYLLTKVIGMWVFAILALFFIVMLAIGINYLW